MDDSRNGGHRGGFGPDERWESEFGGAEGGNWGRRARASESEYGFGYLEGEHRSVARHYDPWSGPPNLRAYTGPWARPRPERHYSDEEIRGMVLDAIDENPHVPESADISVKVEEGVVTMMGAVRSRIAKIEAGEEAWATPGVQDVFNNIHIQSRKKEMNSKP